MTRAARVTSPFNEGSLDPLTHFSPKFFGITRLGDDREARFFLLFPQKESGESTFHIVFFRFPFSIPRSHVAFPLNFPTLFFSFEPCSLHTETFN